MRTFILTAVALLVAGPAQAGQYGAQYSDQGSGAWQDVPPVPLNVPARVAPAPRPMAQMWHDHDDRAGGRGGGDAYAQDAWQDRADRHDWRATARADRRPGDDRRAGRERIIPSYWMSPAYAVTNWNFYGLRDPGYGRHWLRYYDAVVLVDDRGTVIDSVDDLDWDRSASTYADAALGSYGYGARYGGQALGSTYAPPIYPQPGYAPAVAYAPPPLVATYASPGFATTTIVQSAPVVTTTTTTTTYDEVVTPRIVRAVPRHVWHRPRRAACCCLCR